MMNIADNNGENNHKRSKYNGHTKDVILKHLGEHVEGLTIADISRQLDMHRQTVTKYMYELIGAGKVGKRWIGAASLHYIIGNGNGVEKNE